MRVGLDLRLVNYFGLAFDIFYMHRLTDAVLHVMVVLFCLAHKNTATGLILIGNVACFYFVSALLDKVVFCHEERRLNRFSSYLWDNRLRVSYTVV
jgi:hypothetical protein